MQSIKFGKWLKMSCAFNYERISTVESVLLAWCCKHDSLQIVSALRIGDGTIPDIQANAKYELIT